MKSLLPSAWVSAAATFLFAFSASAATLTLSASAPTPGVYDIYNFTGAGRDGLNVGNYGTDGANNDFETYLAHDRVNQGQTFTTGSSPGGYLLTDIWIKHVGYITNGTVPDSSYNGTYWDMASRSTFTIRVTKPTPSGTSVIPLDTETYATTGSEGWPTTSTHSANGDGEWLHFTLATPFALATNTTYGFDLTVNGNGNTYLEWLGTGSAVFSGGTAYKGNTAGESGGPDNVLGALAGDRVFLLQLTPEAQPQLAANPVPGNQIQVSWPAPSTGYVLQSTTNVTGPWNYANLIVTNASGTNAALDSLANTAAFYRLAYQAGAPLPIPVVSVQSNADGATLQMNPGTLRLQVFSPGIVRVAYSPSNAIPTNSLVVTASSTNAGWTLTQNGNNVSLTTAQLQVQVNGTSGAVGFYDTNGNPLLLEPPSGGKSLTPANVAGLNTLQSQQQFLLASNEAIYGFGEHQAGIMNYRGTSVHLQQQNPGQSGIPVLVSSQGYGVLWDNPAVTDVGVGNSNQQVIPASQLLTTNGQPGGLSGSYYNGEDFDTFVGSRTDAQINFIWTSVAPMSLPLTSYSVRWTGSIQAEQAGYYTLLGTADDGMRVWIDGQLVIDDWYSRAAQTDTAYIYFAANSLHSIRVDYYQDNNTASVNLSWILPSTNSTITWSSETANAIDYYFIYGPEFDNVIANYRGLTGTPPLFGKWAWGFWQCKNHYTNQAQVLGVASEYRSLNIPLDCVIQDWQYWTPNPWGSHLFDTNRYPNVTQMMQTMHGENAHLILSVWARFDTNIANANALSAVNGLYTNVLANVSPAGFGQWYDPFNASARAVYWSEIATNLFSLGIDGWWLDASEPELSGNWGEFRTFTTAAGPGAQVFNAYPLMHTTGVYQGHRATNSAKRSFILTRSAYPGQQRNGAVTWSGDINGTWPVFADQIPAGLNFTVTGIPYWNTDTGGFNDSTATDPTYSELFTRWFQFSSFCPMFRVHGNNDKAIYLWPTATQNILINYDQLRYHLLPYIYSVSWMVTSEGYTMMRPLIMDFRQDTAVYNVRNQYMFGPALMPCPVVEPVTNMDGKSTVVAQSGQVVPSGTATNRNVYLPAGATWLDFWTGQSYAGGQTISANAPIQTMPLYVRAGSIIPYGPNIQYATQSSDPIELRVYPGANGSFTLYEDEFDNYDYETGSYATIPFTWNDATQTLTIGQQQGSFPGMLTSRTFNVVWVSPGHGVGVPLTAAPDATVTYTGSAIQVSAGN